jgi:hypothetical protein
VEPGRQRLVAADGSERSRAATQVAETAVARVASPQGRQRRSAMARDT